MLKTMAEAIREATDYILNIDKDSFVMGEGVPDPKEVFGTTRGLKQKYPERVFDMPISEGAGTGVCIGAAITGKRPIMIHQRIDFMMYAMDQLVNNAAKWYSMFGGQTSVPMVVRCIIGRGWGQGNQHSQNLSWMFAGVPGLKVVMPSTAYNAKGLLIAAHRDPNPVIFIEHRWLHNTTSEVPEEAYEVEIGKARVVKEGDSVTIVCWSHMVHEVMKAVEFMEHDGFTVEVIDLMTVSPIDFNTILDSVVKTEHLLVVEEGWFYGNIADTIVSRASSLVSGIKTKTLTCGDYYSPSSPSFAQKYYPSVDDILFAVHEIVEVSYRAFDGKGARDYVKGRVHDVPDKNFKGPF